MVIIHRPGDHEAQTAHAHYSRGASDCNSVVTGVFVAAILVMVLVTVDGAPPVTIVVVLMLAAVIAWFTHVYGHVRPTERYKKMLAAKRVLELDGLPADLATKAGRYRDEWVTQYNANLYEALLRLSTEDPERHADVVAEELERLRKSPSAAD
jgi:uncharacterized membrane protein